MAENSDELKQLLMKVETENAHSELQLNVKKPERCMPGRAPQRYLTPPPPVFLPLSTGGANRPPRRLPRKEPGLLRLTRSPPAPFPLPPAAASTSAHREAAPRFSAFAAALAGHRTPRRAHAQRPPVPSFGVLMETSRESTADWSLRFRPAPPPLLLAKMLGARELGILAGLIRGKRALWGCRPGGSVWASVPVVTPAPPFSSSSTCSEQADVEGAPDEIKDLYREYKMLKHDKGTELEVIRQQRSRDPPAVKQVAKGVSVDLAYLLISLQVWKQKWQKKGEQFGGGGGGGGRHVDRSSDACFRCGGLGHWASQCKGRAAEQLPVGDPSQKGNGCVAEEEVPLLTLEEVAQMTNTAYRKVSADGCASSPGAPKQEEEGHLHVPRPAYDLPSPPAPMHPLYEPGQDGKVRETPPEVFRALSELGYSSFRPGQEAAVMKILSGLSTLVVLSTGMGKSLCYQLPAYLYAKRSKCITLVISPLVSLMDDQVSGLPQRLKAVCIHSNMSKTQREAAVDKVKAGKVHVLLLSPEALVGGGFSGSSCLPAADQLPPVAFACIDEAHCVSEWSHNFRPCYLRLCKVLRDRLGVRCFLGLTATATVSTAQDVAHHLGIQEGEGIAIRSAAVPPNLHLSVSTDRDKDQALVNLLQGERFGSLDSVIVYCTRREETTRIAALIRTCLQGVKLKEPVDAAEKEEDDDDTKAGKRKKAKAKKSIRRPLKWIADAYHAGMSAAERRRVQNNFMSGQLRVVVATVAFGMGLDKSDVRGVVHYNMPKNFESYVQEIGRAGRDGKPAQCHLFLHPEGEDLHELRRHIYADTVDYFAVKRLVQKVFPRCKCWKLRQKQQEVNKDHEVEDAEMLAVSEASGEELLDTEEGKPRVCHKHERAIPIQQTVEALDFREEGIETLLCYLELHPRGWVELLHPTFSSCRVMCYGGPQELRTVARRSRTFVPIRSRSRQYKSKLFSFSFSFCLCTGSRTPGKSKVLVEFSTLSFHLRSYGDLTDRELDSVCAFLHRRVVGREKVALRQLQLCFQAFQSVAFRSSAMCSDFGDEEKSSQLKALLMDYFEKEMVPEEEDPVFQDEEQGVEGLQDIKFRDWEEQIRADIRHFLSIRQEEKFSGRAVARIFHGIGSPRYPAQIFGRDRRFWRRYLCFDFNKLMRLATEEIIRWK
ncbi:ATP-dependent DNA helicase Q4 [Sphaerodactylus townsendi]|uniref:ATP-dependent DNA helicase Q4 n=1 Tax=Sphaerodactylus townsendi TaxID=933632 RepID=UPI002025D16C|nr:ATP-dependent DNA helicase Q4 [Sphaerodactylus townsendi]